MVSDHAEFVAAVRALDAAFVRHANAGELDQLVAACYAEDALVLPPTLPLVQGQGQIPELFRELLEAGAGGVVRETIPLHAAGAVGYGIGRYTCGCSHDGKETHRDSGKFLLVYRRQGNGAWKIVVEMFSSDLPAA